MSVPGDWTVETLTALLRSAGGAPGWDGSRPLFVAADPLPPSDRVGAPAHPPTPCLVWTGPDSGTTPRYGRVRIGGVYKSTHTTLYRLAGGSIPAIPRHDLAHTCERSLCARPDHMRPLTRSQHGREASNRRWPDRILALAPDLMCPQCGSPGTVSITLGGTAGTPSWRYTCHPCSAAWHRARRQGRGHEVYVGSWSRSMDPEIRKVVRTA